MREDLEINLTYFSRRLFYGVLADNPAGTLVGAGVGIIAGTAFEIARQYFALSVPFVATWVWVIAGVTLVNVRRAATRQPLPENLERSLLVIERARLGGLPSSQLNAMYRRLFDVALVTESSPPNGSNADADVKSL
jgi:hypothetical protein